MSREFDLAQSPLDPGLSVIEASAGTGKTYAISHLVPRLLLEGSATRLSEILLVTFTNDAARELSDRVRRVLERLATPAASGEEDPGIHALREQFPPDQISRVAAEALLDLDQLGVSTIHSFCQRTLQTDGVLCGLPVMPELIPDANEILDAALAEYWTTKIAPDPLLSALAAAEQWTLRDDLSLIRAGLGTPDAQLVPPPGNLEETLEILRQCPERFPQEDCRELLNAFTEAAWNKQAGPDFIQAAHRLVAGGPAHTPGFLAAVKKITTAGELLKKMSKADKANCAAILALPLLETARETTAVAGRVRWALRAAMLHVVTQEVRRTLRRNRQITYDGLIDALHSALQGPQCAALITRLRDRYRVALIDESQDTDARQFEIFRRVFTGTSSHRLVLIGDPKQAIYAFRGADVNTYLDARREAGGRVFHLTKTYRAPTPLVGAVNALFLRKDSLLKPGLDFFPAQSGLRHDCQLVLHGEPCTSRLEAWVAEEGSEFSNKPKRLTRIADAVAGAIVGLFEARAAIQERADARPATPGDIAVLVSLHEEARAVAEALHRWGVPSIRSGVDDVLHTEEASDLLLVLRALHEPRHAGLRLAALTTRLLGRIQSDLTRRDDAAEESCIQHFVSWQATWFREGIAAALAEIDRQEHFTLRLAGLQFGERRVTNLRQLTDLLQSVSGELGHRPGHLLKWLSREINRSSLHPADERLQQIESDAAAVQIVTMHASKGLEYPLVFCPFLWSSRKPSGIQKFSPGGPPQIVDLKAADPAVLDATFRVNLEDRLRLAYVAMTRAKVKVWVCAGEVVGDRAEASALDWILTGGDPQDFATWKGSFQNKDRGPRHRAGFEALAQAGNATRTITVTALPPAPKKKWTPPHREESDSFAVLPAPALPPPWSLTSFSALTREKNPHAAEESPEPPESTAESPAPNSFLTAPGGTTVGTAIHNWIERWDFKEFAAGDLATHCAAYSIATPPDSPPFWECAAGMLRNLRASTLPGLDCPVAEACPAPHASEWHFQLPISTTLNTRSLADVFAAHGHAEYARSLAALPTEDIAGYLHGFLDRIAFFKGTWGVIDWKTNNLGPTPAHYGQDALLASAKDSHYFLQAHLYLVALRRYLGPQARIAGAWLVYLRGVLPNTSDGILFLNPPPKLLAALDALFAAPSSPRP